jgi:hypothetical protein
MITNEEMQKLGFEKRPTLAKKKTGISKYCWVMSNHFKLSIEREMCPLNEGLYEPMVPTLKIQGYVYNFLEIEELKKVLTALSLLDSDGDSF